MCKSQLLKVEGQRRADNLRREDANKTERAHSQLMLSIRTKIQKENIKNLYLEKSK